MRLRGLARNVFCLLGVFSIITALVFCSSFLGRDDLSRLLDAERQRSQHLEQSLVLAKAERATEKAAAASATAQGSAVRLELEQSKVLVLELEAQLAQAQREYRRQLAEAKAMSPAPSPPPAALEGTAGAELQVGMKHLPPPPGSYKAVGLAAVADKSYQKRFDVAMASQRCFAQRHGYDYNVIDPVDYPVCSFRDFFFRKHCAVARFLEKQKPDYILFVMDGDNPVVQLDRSLDHWLKEAAATDVVLYERWMNNEIMAGNYAVRNSKFGIDFCDGWAAFANEMPRAGYHSSDNGAIHLHVIRTLGLKNEKPCLQLWNHLGSDKNTMDEYFAYVSCTRLVMGAPRRWKVSSEYRITILPRGHSWSIDGGDADSKTSSVGAISHHGQKTADNYLQYFQRDFVMSGKRDCDSMLKGGTSVSAEKYGESLWQKLKSRTDGALVDWTRQHPPPWDWLYLGCMKTLSCRPLDNDEPLSVALPRPPQAKLPYVRMPKGAKFEACAKEWETCNCVGLVYYGVQSTGKLSPVVRVTEDAGSIACRSDTFDGDPAVGDAKKCYCARNV